MPTKRRFGDTASTIYSEAASIGKGFAYLKAIMGCIFSIVLIAGGFFVRKQKNVYTTQVSLIVSSVQRITVGTNKDGTPIIDYKVSGTVKDCSANIITIQNYKTDVSPGQIVIAWMRPGCIGSDAVQTPTNYKMIGNVMIGIGVIIILIALVSIYFVGKYKGVAAVHGATSVLGMFR
jgi:hypothetical protein